MSELVGAIVHSQLATLHELQTVYSYGDALDLYEVIAVSGHNERVMSGG